MPKCEKCGVEASLRHIILDRCCGLIRERMWQADLCGACQSELAERLHIDTCGGKENSGGTEQRRE